jgi:hypothetical protein
VAAINFYSGENTILNMNGSGLGFFGDAGFGASVPVNEYQGRTFITDGAGATQGAECWNIKFVHASSGVIGQLGSGLGLTRIPNYQATLNIRFTHDSAVRTQNGVVRIYDRVNINNGASGVTTKVAELIHPWTTQTPDGSGDSTWLTPVGSSVVVDLVASPGISGLRPLGSNSSDTRHDFYLAISASPNSIGSKQLYGLYCSLEYF